MPILETAADKLFGGGLDVVLRADVLPSARRKYILDRSFLNGYSQTMGRPRQFAEINVVDAAAAVFRQRGYAATSIDHLVDATGVHRGSLYGVFGSKHGLFLRVLDAVDAPDTDSVHRLDVILVGLLELAPTDPRIRERIRSLISANDITEEQLGERLLARAALRKEREPT